jgi:hypothetical protein
MNHIEDIEIIENCANLFAVIRKLMKSNYKVFTNTEVKVKLK